MMTKLFRKFTARLVFFAGLFVMTLGISFLLGVLEGASGISVFFAFLLVVGGAVCAFFAVKLNKRPAYLFFTSLFMMTGLFLFLSALGIIDLPIPRAWPLLSVFSGLALLPMGWRRYGAPRKTYIVPSCAFVALGCVLLIFSLQIVPFSFRHFMYTWWPLLFLFGGLTLVLISLGSRRSE
ncbi:MAG: hypothetical protein FWD91_08485 [Treponema sp.]|nr:hypothetical protein [Treponema sp.]